MATPENCNPFDSTIWDPISPEHAIEDPMHGPSAVDGLLGIPPMPLGYGIYCQPGGFYTVGTVYFDAKDQPIYRIGNADGMSRIRQEMHDLEEWRQAGTLGEDALIALEAQRQQARLNRSGAAYAFKSSDVCGGGKRLDQCDTASDMVRQAQESASAERPKAPGAGRRWNTLARLGRACSACSLNCQVAYETWDGEPTGITRISNSQPSGIGFPVIRLDLR